jgi:hypothetical protein
VKPFDGSYGFAFDPALNCLEKSAANLTERVSITVDQANQEMGELLQQARQCATESLISKYQSQGLSYEAAKARAEAEIAALDATFDVSGDPKLTLNLRIKAYAGLAVGLASDEVTLGEWQQQLSTLCSIASTVANRAIPACTNAGVDYENRRHTLVGGALPLINSNWGISGMIPGVGASPLLQFNTWLYGGTVTTSSNGGVTIQTTQVTGQLSAITRGMVQRRVNSVFGKIARAVCFGTKGGIAINGGGEVAGGTGSQGSAVQGGLSVGVFQEGGHLYIVGSASGGGVSYTPQTSASLVPSPNSLQPNVSGVTVGYSASVTFFSGGVSDWKGLADYSAITTGIISVSTLQTQGNAAQGVTVGINPSVTVGGALTRYATNTEVAVLRIPLPGSGC